MPLVADRVKESTTTTGTGTLTLLGAATGFTTFVAGVGSGVTVYYTIAGPSEWEVGVGTTGAGTLTRTTVLSSSNGGSLVNFSAGTKDVFCTYPAGKAVMTDDAATLTNKTISGASNTLSSIGNASLTNSTVTVNGVSIALGASNTVTAAASTLSGTTLAAGVTASSLTSVGTLAGLTVTAPITGSVTGSSGSTTGNAATATALQTARNINGVSFNGTADVTVTAAAGTLSGATLASGVTASSLTSVGTLATLTTSGTTSLATAAGALSVRNVAYTFPAAQGAASTLLTNNGSGTLTWATASAPAQTIVSTATSYNMTSADAGKQIVYTGGAADNIFTGAAFAAALTTGQFVDIANTSTNATITIGGGQIFETGFTQSTVNAQVRAMRKYANGKILIAFGNSLVRFNANGTVDSTFTTQVANNAIYDIALTTDESAIYVTGQFTNWDTAGASRQYMAKLNGSTGALDTGWNPYMVGPKFSIAVSGTTVCVGGDKIEFFSTSGAVLANFWRQYSGEPDTCSTPNGVIIRAHPSIANTFIAVGPNYIYTDSSGTDYTQNYFAWHVTTYGTPVQYTVGAVYGAPTYNNQSQNVVVTSTHIYYAYDYASTFTYLVRFTLGSAGSVTQSNYQQVYSAQTKMLWQRGTDGSWWAGMTGNRVSPPAPTALVGWTSALATITPYNVLSWGGFAIAGAALTDGSFLLGNVANGITDKYLDKTVLAPEGGATIVGPPQSSGGGSTSSSSGQSYKQNTTVRLQKLASGSLLVAQRNTPFFS